MFNRSTIASRINKVIKARIAEAQAEFDEFCKDGKIKLEAKLEALRNDHETEKEVKADTLVSKILK